MDAAKDILALRNAVLAAVTNADTWLYTPFQALRCGWPVESHYKEEDKRLRLHSDHDCSRLMLGDHGYKDPFKAMVFINGLSDANGKYKARLENAQAERASTCTPRD